MQCLGWETKVSQAGRRPFAFPSTSPWRDPAPCPVLTRLEKKQKAVPGWSRHGATTRCQQRVPKACSRYLSVGERKLPVRSPHGPKPPRQLAKQKTLLAESLIPGKKTWVCAKASLYCTLGICDTFMVLIDLNNLNALNRLNKLRLSAVYSWLIAVSTSSRRQAQISSDIFV